MVISIALDLDGTFKVGPFRGGQFFAPEEPALLARGGSPEIGEPKVGHSGGAVVAFLFSFRRFRFAMLDGLLNVRAKRLFVFDLDLLASTHSKA